jgi:hypothetical protein
MISNKTLNGILTFESEAMIYCSNVFNVLRQPTSWQKPWYLNLASSRRLGSSLASQWKLCFKKWRDPKTIHLNASSIRAGEESDNMPYCPSFTPPTELISYYGFSLSNLQAFLPIKS